MQVDTAEDALVCIPGTHAKWARMRDGRLVGFTTYVTGELYQLLRNESLVGRLADGDAFDGEAFVTGLDRGAGTPLSRIVFSSAAADRPLGRCAGPKAPGEDGKRA